MKTLLWLDDLRNPENFLNKEEYNSLNVIWAHSYKEFVEYFLYNDIPDIIWFDHDLGEGENGYDCAKFLVRYCQEGDKPLPEYHSQSQNPVGRENILNYLYNYERYRNKEREEA